MTEFYVFNPVGRTPEERVRGPFVGDPADIRVTLKGAGPGGADIVCVPCPAEDLEVSWAPSLAHPERAK